MCTYTIYLGKLFQTRYFVLNIYIYILNGYICKNIKKMYLETNILKKIRKAWASSDMPSFKTEISY